MTVTDWCVTDILLTALLVVQVLVGIYVWHEILYGIIAGPCAFPTSHKKIPVFILKLNFIIRSLTSKIFEYLRAIFLFGRCLHSDVLNVFNLSMLWNIHMIWRWN